MIAKAASMKSRRFCVSHCAPLKAPAVSSPQVRASLIVRKGRIFLGAVSNQRVDPYGGFGLVVDAATRIKVAVLLDQLERIARPVLALRLDDIDMREQQNRLELRIATGVEGDQPAFLRMIRRREHLNFCICEAGRFEVRGHAFRGERATARRQGGVGLDELLIQRPKLRFAVGSCAAHLGAQQQKCRADEGGPRSFHPIPPQECRD